MQHGPPLLHTANQPGHRPSASASTRADAATLHEALLEFKGTVSLMQYRFSRRFQG